MSAHSKISRANFQGDGGRFASDREQLATVDEMQFLFGRDIALRCPDAAARRPYLFLRQGRADFETVRQGAEQRGLLFGQHAGQPMPWERLKAEC